MPQSLLGSVHEDLGRAAAVPGHLHVPGPAADLTILDEGALYVRFQIDLDVLEAVGTLNHEIGLHIGRSRVTRRNGPGARSLALPKSLDGV